MLMEIPPLTSSTKHLNHGSRSSEGSLSRLLAAAVINKKFRDLLLTHPKEALRQGFQGEKFQLSGQDRRRVLTIQARDLADFALQLTSQEEPRAQACSSWFLTTKAAPVLNAEK